MPEIDFECVESFLRKLDFSRNQKKIVYDNISEKISKNINRISLYELDSVAGGGINLDALSKEFIDADDKN